MTLSVKSISRALCCLALLPTAGLARSVDELAARLDAEIPQRLEQYDIPGAALALVLAGSSPLLRGYGTVDPTTGEGVEPSRHVFRVGSVSKPLTASIVLQLFHDSGRDLHADLRPLLASLPVRPPLEQALTMHQLLTHTAGFNEQLFGQHVATAARLVDLTTYLNRHLPPRFTAPGEIIAYNDHHTVLAGWVAEQIGDAPFETLAEATLFTPLGMRATTFRQADQPTTVTEGRVLSWHRNRSGEWQPYEPDYVLTTPAAGAFSTASDMARYLARLLDCTASHPPVVPCRQQLARQAGHHPRLPGRSYGFAEGRHGGVRVLFKDGQASGFNARALIAPELGLAVFVVHNRNVLGGFGGFHPAARFNREITGVVLDMLHPGSDAAVLAPLPRNGAARRPEIYAGDYRNVVAARHSWERIAGMFDDVHVRVVPGGVDLGYGAYLEVAPGLLQWHEGGDHFIAFRLRDSGPASHLFIGGGAYERIGFYGASWFTPWFVGVVGVWFVAAAISLAARASGVQRLAALAAAVAFLGFLAGFAAIAAVTDVQRFFFGPTVLLQLVLALPLLGAAALLVQVSALTGGYRDLEPTARAAVVISLLVGASFLAWLWYWNLLGVPLH